MLEVGWSEILVIALILIIVVGPKDLPGMLRTFGRMATRVRGMANEFRSQFDEALREAELDDVRKGLSEVNKLNPTNSLRDAINPIRKLGEDIKSDLRKATDLKDEPSTSAGVSAVEEKTDAALPASNPVLEPVAQLAPTQTEPEALKTPPVVVQPAPLPAVVEPKPVPAVVDAKPLAVAADEKPKAKRTTKPKAEKADGDVEKPARAPRKSTAKVASETPDAPKTRKKSAKKSDETGDA
ncbi:sec-independent protein translocase protein TatB [Rhizobium sp. SG_E_25_P2]|uniref:Sec-independent protein translocase protein TatB n=1 Tax=Rhizobium sp. SG_E_25_P2 TaxID=2879942 RepID=UPI0024762CD0|nr:Sec-independent protein translocase protein TatB [Rhizobium sp. SG_E_25_P2]MDH6268075.1 sec-independent protein translocase protein TatB [Rhizobium sp. SG_E_25_P2]